MCVLPTPETVLHLPSLFTDPATLPRHEQRMRAVRAIRTNYSLLWQHLDASKVLPKLVDKSVISEAKKKEVESHQQSCGQNGVIISALFTVECAPEGLLAICDVLQTTPGKEHIAQHILQGTIQSVFRCRLVGGCSLTSTYTLIAFSQVTPSLFYSCLWQHDSSHLFSDLSTIRYLIAYSMQKHVLLCPAIHICWGAWMGWHETSKTRLHCLGQECMCDMPSFIWEPSLLV